MFLAPAVAMGAGHYEDVGTCGLNSVKWDSVDVERVGYWPYGPPRRVLAEGDHVYVGMGGGIWVFDVSDPDSPVVVGKAPANDLVEGMYYRDGLLCVACGYGGICVVDVSDPTRPEVRGRYIDGTFFSKVRLWNSYLIANAPHAVTFYDISDPDTVRLVCGYDYQDLGKILGVADSILFVTRYVPPIIIVVDMYSPESLVVLDSIEVGWCWNDMVYRDGYIYVGGETGVRIINVVNPESVYIRGSIGHPWYYIVDVELVRDYLYCLNSDGELYVMDVSDPDTVVVAGTVSDFGRRMSLAGDYLYVVTDRLFKAVDCSDPVDPMVVYEKLDCPGPGYGLDVEGRYAYYGCGRGGVYILDVRNPMNVREVSRIGIYGGLVMVDSARGRMYVTTEGEDGLKKLLIYDVSDVWSPVEISEVDLGEDEDGEVDVERLDTLLFVGVGRKMKVLDVSDPIDPVVLGELEGNTEAVEVEMGDTGIVYVLWEYELWDDDTLYVVDVSSPNDPEVLAAYSVGDLLNWMGFIVELSDIEFWRGYLIIKALIAYHGYYWITGVIDFHDIYDPQLVYGTGWIDGIPGSIMFLSGDRLYLTEYSHLWIYRLSDEPFEAECMGEYNMVEMFNGFLGGDEENNLIYMRTVGRGLQIFHYVYDTVGVREEDCVERSPGPSDLLVLEGGVGKVFLDLPSSGFMRVEAYDVVGRYVGEVYRGYLSGGRRDVKVDLSGLRSGVYFLRMEGPGIEEMRRVLLVR